MPEFCCVQCYSCATFQAQQVKKVPRFTCKICNEKQTVRKVYATSCAAKDVRLVVQSLNMQRGEADNAEEDATVVDPAPAEVPTSAADQKENRWAAYSQGSEIAAGSDDDDAYEECCASYLTSVDVVNKAQRGKQPRDSTTDALHRGSAPLRQKVSTSVATLPLTKQPLSSNPPPMVVYNDRHALDASRPSRAAPGMPSFSTHLHPSTALRAMPAASINLPSHSLPSWASGLPISSARSTRKPLPSQPLSTSLEAPLTQRSCQARADIAEPHAAVAPATTNPLQANHSTAAGSSWAASYSKACIGPDDDDDGDGNDDGDGMFFTAM